MENICSHYLTPFVGRDIKINRKGPNSFSGTLLHLGSDLLVMDIKDEGVVYVNLKHVKNIMLEAERKQVNPEERPSFCKANSFTQLLKNLQNSVIQVNRGPEKVQGIVIDAQDEWISLSDPKQRLTLIPTFHIQNVSLDKQSNITDLNENSQERSQTNREMETAKEKVEENLDASKSEPTSSQNETNPKVTYKRVKVAKQSYPHEKEHDPNDFVKKKDDEAKIERIIMGHYFKG